MKIYVYFIADTKEEVYGSSDEEEVMELLEVCEDPIYFNGSEDDLNVVKGLLVLKGKPFNNFTSDAHATIQMRLDK